VGAWGEGRAKAEGATLAQVVPVTLVDAGVSGQVRSTGGPGKTDGQPGAGRGPNPPNLGEHGLPVVSHHPRVLCEVRRSDGTAIVAPTWVEVPGAVSQHKAKAVRTPRGRQAQRE